MTELTVGVVGLGRMGGNVAAHLAEAGFEVCGFDVSGDARAAAQDEGVALEESARGVARESDLVLTSLPSPEAVEEAYMGESGILSGADDGDVAMEVSTIDPDTTERVAAAAADRGVDLVDAPVSGGPEDAARGTLSVLLGGDEAVIEAPPVAPILDALCSQSFHVGSVGAGHTAKLLNNVMSMGNLLLAMEAVSLGVDRGLDGERLWRALANSGGSSNQFEKRMPRVLNRNFEPGFTVDFARKDLGLALEAADASAHAMPVTALIHQLYTQVCRQGHAESDVGAIATLFEAAGAPVRADEPVDESFEGY